MGHQLPSRILVIKPSALGDVVQAVGVVRALSEALHSAEIGWLVNAEFAPLIEPLSFVTRIHRFERARMRGLAGKLRSTVLVPRLVSELRAPRYDAVLDLQGLARSGLFGLLSGAQRRVGFRDAREGASMTYTDAVSVAEPILHTVDRQFTLAQALCPSVVDTAPRHLESNEAERDAARALLQMTSQAQPTVAFVPGARWASKVWPAEHWSALADALAESGVRVALLGSPAESALVARVAEGARSEPLNLCGRTNLRLLAAVLASVDVAVTNDSGPMHLAAAQGTLLVALFGATDPRRTGPWRVSGTVISSPLATGDPRRYRQVKDDRLMRAITVHTVLSAVLSTLPSGRTE